MAGDAYAFAYPFVALLGTAAAIELSGFALDPSLTAHDRAGVVLATRGWALVAYGAMLLLLPSQGPAAAGLGAIAAASVVRVRLALAARRLLRA
ncbi:MAG: polysaccharide biosynthesis protein, partial [Sphingomonas sp.]|nr:polysaccharide biosynthesis protein [Sphingomonas sp.]